MCQPGKNSSENGAADVLAQRKVPFALTIVPVGGSAAIIKLLELGHPKERIPPSHHVGLAKRLIENSMN